MMNPTKFDSIALEPWCSEEEKSNQFESMLETYLYNYDSAFRSKC